MCERSGGLVHNVKANEFCESMTESLQEKFIASHLTVSIQLPKVLKFRNEDPNSLSLGGSRFTRKMGNTSNEPVSFYFEYELKSVKELLEMNLDQPLESYLKEVNFQMVISYTQPDGSKFVRVCNLTQSVCNEREQLEASANLEILSANAIQ